MARVIPIEASRRVHVKLEVGERARVIEKLSSSKHVLGIDESHKSILIVHIETKTQVAAERYISLLLDGRKV